MPPAEDIMTSAPYFAVVTFGSPTYGNCRSHYRSLARAIADARTLGGGSCTTVRVVRCETRREALDADVSGRSPVVWSR